MDALTLLSPISVPSVNPNICSVSTPTMRVRLSGCTTAGRNSATDKADHRAIDAIKRVICGLGPCNRLARRVSPARAVSLTGTSDTYAPNVEVSSGAIQLRAGVCRFFGVITRRAYNEIDMIEPNVAANQATPRMPRTIWMLGFVSLLMDTSSELIHALLPIFLVTTLGASALTVGIIEGFAEATTSITKIFSGVISDWIGKRKPLVVLGYGLAALTKLLFPLPRRLGWSSQHELRIESERASGVRLATLWSRI
jgi:hypothetical protein